MFLGNLEKISREEFEKIINEKNNEKRAIKNKIIDEFYITGYNISNVNFINCLIYVITDTSFKNCYFENCWFNLLQFVTTDNCEFSVSSFRDSVIYDSCFNETKFNVCDFYESAIKDTKFNNIESCQNKFFDLQCPEKGEFIGYKKLIDFYYNKYLCKLLIPEDAKRSSATTKKCRCSKAKVLEIVNIKTGENVNSVTHMILTNSAKDTCFNYKVNEFVYPDEWDEDRFNECSHGIHFFMDIQDALDY